MNKWLRILAVFVALVGCVWIMMWGIGQSSREHLAKINQQLAVIESMSPKQYHEKMKQDLLKQKEFEERLVKSYDEKGTTYVIYRAMLGIPQATRAIIEHYSR